MIELNNERRRAAEEKEVKARDLEVRGVFENQSRFGLGERSDIAAGNGLAPGDQQYLVTDRVTGEVFLIIDHRTIAKTALAVDIRRQLDIYID